MPPRTSVVAAALIASCGCRTPTDRVPVSASSGLAAAPERVVIADPDEGELVTLRPATGGVERLAIGGEPVRIAVAGAHLLATLRAERAVGVLVDDGPGAGLREVDRVEVGPEPVGIVAGASPEGPVRAWVAVSLGDEVVELDPESGEILRRFPVPGQPRWLVLDERAGQLFVASARGSALHRVDLATGAVIAEALPAVEGRPIRVTGDPCLLADDGTLAVPALVADPGAPAEGAGEGQGFAVGSGVVQIEPVLVLRSPDPLAPTVPVLAVTRDGGVRRSPLASATCAPDGRFVVATMDGSDRTLVVDREPFRTQTPAEPHRDDVPLPTDAPGLWERPIATLATPGGPVAAAFDGDGGLWVAAARARTATRHRWDDAEELVAAAAEARAPVAQPVLEPAERHLLGPVSLDPDAELGRHLFHSALEPHVSEPGSGVTCASCHEGGRDDGITWATPDGPRQTPSLAGGPFGTAPFGWSAGIPTVGELADRVAIEWMGGIGLDPLERHALEVYLETLRPPDVAAPSGLGEEQLVALGEALFGRSDVGCAACHAGPDGTDGQAHDLGDGPLDTPRLVGVAATPPYLHDGRAPSLDAALDHAGPLALDPDQRDALTRYLRTR